MKGTNEFKQVIKAYLDTRAKTDALFARSYAKEGKNLDECCNYIFSEVQKSGMNGFADEEVFGMAMHYYDEDNVGEITQVADGRVVVNHHVELTQEEKAEARAKALADYREQCVKEERERVKRLAERRQAQTSPTDNQPSLFDV